MHAAPLCSGITYAFLQVESDVFHREVLLLLVHFETNLVQYGQKAALERLHGLELVADDKEGVVEALDAHLDGRVEL